MTTQQYSSVWDALEDAPQQAASLRARSTLMMALSDTVQQRGLTQTEAAGLFGVTQPRVSDLMRGKMHLFSLDTLMDMACAAGLDPTVKVRKARQPKPPRHSEATARATAQTP